MNFTPFTNFPQTAVLTNLWNDEKPDSEDVPESAGPLPNNTKVGGYV